MEDPALFVSDEGWDPFENGDPRIPRALRKAEADPFTYAVGLRNGWIIQFESAGIRGKWVYLTGIQAHNIRGIETGGDGKPYPFNFERGIEVRLADIVWAADAPHGS